MRNQLSALALVMTAIAVAGCGSSSSTTSHTNASTSPASTSATTSSQVKAKTYKVKLVGSNEIPAGTPSGSATAVISIRAKTNQLCWKFSNLKGVTTPTAAHLHKAPAGSAGPIVVPFGGTYTASGCTPVPVPVLSQIEAGHKGYYVNIHNQKYPGGAVRAQL
jgi:CHRD domain